MLNFANAPEPTESGLGGVIPDGTLAWVEVIVRPANAGANQIEKVSPKGSKYLDIELTVAAGPFKGRKLWDMLLTHHPEGKGLDAAQAGFKAILEANGASPQNPAAYQVPGYMAFSGLIAAVRIKVEPAEPYKDRQGVTQPGKEKNRVAIWLSPFAARTQKEFNELVGKDGPRPGSAAPQNAPTPGYQTTHPNLGGYAPQQPSVQQVAQAYGAQAQQPGYGQPAPGFQPAQPAFGQGPQAWGAPQGQQVRPNDIPF